LSGGESNAPA
jgi:hypothetical protein